MKILAFDPGKNNFAWAVINSKGKCRAHGFVRSITTMEPGKFPDELTRFWTDCTKLIEAHNPTMVIIERMQHRPKLGGGAVVEYINIMIGLIFGMARGKVQRDGIVPVTPPTWKNHFRKVWGIPDDQPFAMVKQKISVKAKKGATRKIKGKVVAKKTETIEVPGLLDDQLDGRDLTPHEADAIGIACYGWYTMTRMDIVHQVVT